MFLWSAPTFCDHHSVAIVREWDGGSYDRISAPMEQLGREVLDRLPLHGDEVVLDAGCGSGRVTAALLERLPHGRVLGVDGSEAMLDAARARLGTDPRVEFLRSDLAELDIGDRRCDAILSTATFHWVPNHSSMLERLRAALRDGGRMAAQCGGHGNIDTIHDAANVLGAEPPFAEFLADWTGPWNFRQADDMRRDLLAAGFRHADCRLVKRPVVPDDPVEWFRTIVLGSHIAQLPEHLRDPFIRAVIERLPTPVTVDYVRLDIDAVA